MDSYRVQSTFAAEDKLSPVLERIAKLSLGVDKGLEAVLKRLEALSKFAAFDALIKRTDGLEKNINSLATATEHYGRIGESAFTPMIRQIERANAEAAKLAKLLATPPRIPASPSPIQPGRPAVGGGGGRGDGAMGVGMAFYAARGAARSAADFMEPSNEMGHQSYLLGIQGVAPEVMKRLQDTTFALHNKYPTMSAGEILTFGRELLPLMTGTGKDGKPDTSEFFGGGLETAIRASATINGVTQGKGGDEGFIKLMKAGEALGLRFGQDSKTHPGWDLDRWTNEALKSIIASGGLLHPQDIAQFVQQAGSSATAMDPANILERMPELMISGGSSKMGTSLQTLFAKGTGTLSLKSLNSLTKEGIIDADKIVRGKHGTVEEIPLDALKGGSLMAEDPDRWINDVWLPAAQKKYAKQGDLTKNPALLARALNLDFGTRNAAKISEEFILQQGLIDRFQINQKKANPNDYTGSLTQDPTQALNAFTASWKTFTEAIGNSVQPILIPALKGFTDVINGLTKKLVGDDPADKKLAQSAVAVGGALAAGTALSVGGGLLPTALGGGVLAATGGGFLAASALGVPAVGVGFGMDLIRKKNPSFFSAIPDSSRDYLDNGDLGAETSNNFLRDQTGKGLWQTALSTVSRPSFEPLSGGSFASRSLDGGRDLLDILADLPSKIGAAISAAMDGVSVNLDSRRVGSIVSGSIASSLNGPLGGTSSFDTRQSYAPTTGNN